MSRQDVLALLREQEGAFVSGEEISHRLGLSRAAIWKAVDALRREGYTVEARTGRGYRLLDAPDVLTEPEIRRFLGETARVGRTLVCLAEVDSNTIPIYLAQYYFLTGRTQDALDMVEQYVDYVSSDPETWQTAFDLLEQYEQDTDDYRTGVQYIAWKLDTWNQENMGEITVDEEARAFIARMGS